MARAEFGTKKSKESAEDAAKYFSPTIGGILSIGRSLGRVTGKEVTEELGKKLVSEGHNAKSFIDQLFPATIRVLVKQRKAGGGFSRIIEEVKGLNATHAAMRAEANWPGSQISILNNAVIKK